MTIICLTGLTSLEVVTECHDPPPNPTGSDAKKRLICLRLQGGDRSTFENEMIKHTNVYVCLHCYLEHSNVNSKRIIYCLGDRIT